MKRHLRPFVPVSLVPRAFGTIKVGAAKRRRESISPFPARKGSIKENLTRRLFQWRSAALPRGTFKSPAAPFSAAGHAPYLGAFRLGRPRWLRWAAVSLRSPAPSTASPLVYALRATAENSSRWPRLRRFSGLTRPKKRFLSVSASASGLSVKHAIETLYPAKWGRLRASSARVEHSEKEPSRPRT